jgi:protein-disulfide isomerase
MNRRRLFGAALVGLASLPLLARLGVAQEDNWFSILDDDGKPVPNFRLPSELSTEGLPGIVWTGSEAPDVILIEFFDYNCPFCRKAANDLEAVLSKDKNFRLGLVNNAILAPGSIRAAQIEQAVLKFYGPQRAYDFHLKLFEHRGANDGATALQVVNDMGLDAAGIQAAADGADIAGVLKRQMTLANDLGFAATPSFILDGIGILGYPGSGAVSRMISAVRKCDKPAC